MPSFNRSSSESAAPLHPRCVLVCVILRLPSLTVWATLLSRALLRNPRGSPSRSRHVKAIQDAISQCRKCQSHRQSLPPFPPFPPEDTLVFLAPGQEEAAGQA